jgi:hypothetical protein
MFSAEAAMIPKPILTVSTTWYSSHVSNLTPAAAHLDRLKFTQQFDPQVFSFCCCLNVLKAPLAAVDLSKEAYR